MYLYATLLRGLEVTKGALELNLIVCSPLVCFQVEGGRGRVVAQLTIKPHSVMHFLRMKYHHSPCSCFHITLLAIIFNFAVFAFQVFLQHIIGRTWILAVLTKFLVSCMLASVPYESWGPLTRIVTIFTLVLLCVAQVLLFNVISQDCSVLKNLFAIGLTTDKVLIGMSLISVSLHSFPPLLTFQTALKFSLSRFLSLIHISEPTRPD